MSFTHLFVERDDGTAKLTMVWGADMDRGILFPTLKEIIEARNRIAGNYHLPVEVIDFSTINGATIFGMEIMT